MHRFGKPSDHGPLEYNQHQSDHKELNNNRRDNDDRRLNLIVTAIYQLERSKRRAAMFKGVLTVDHGWNILLLIYIYQANGTPVSEQILSQETTLSAETTRRYIKLMQRDGLIEPITIALTTTAISKVETLLSVANEPLPDR